MGSLMRKIPLNTHRFISTRRTIPNIKLCESLDRYSSYSPTGRQPYGTQSVTTRNDQVHLADDGRKPKRTSTLNLCRSKMNLNDGLTFKDFIVEGNDLTATDCEREGHYISNDEYTGNGKKVFFETYGCQMNVNDTEIAWTFLKDSGFTKTTDLIEADVVLVMTCSIREGAEQKIWRRLHTFKSMKKKRSRLLPPLQIGILGCMAERLKEKIIEKEKMVDVVCGPDAYRDLPRLLSVSTGQQAVNVQLSLEETYADIVPVRLDATSHSAFVSIMRGCDNMCTYCIVPFTRGRERSRPIDSIVEEVKVLSDQGVKEVTLLGQNVNSYRDLSQTHGFGGYGEKDVTNMSKGFKTVYKPKIGGQRFSTLLDKVSSVDPEIRIRFTSPHPKDFPDEVLQLIKERSNICNQIHLPAQSGSSSVLEAMRRGYTRESYVDLVHHIRSHIPDVALTSDFIAGFCGETEKDHRDTLSLIEQVKYNFAFCFPYSMREKTRAYHRLKDDVPDEVKIRRHEELKKIFREEAQKLNMAQIGQIQLILVEGVSKRSERDLAGRNDGNTKVILPQMLLEDDITPANRREIAPGDYVIAKITEATSQVLKGVPLCHTTLSHFSKYNFAKKYMRNYVAG